jgi:hypothetical protein
VGEGGTGFVGAAGVTGAVGVTTADGLAGAGGAAGVEAPTHPGVSGPWSESMVICSVAVDALSGTVTAVGPTSLNA